jgi:RNA polymerase sigma-70 factor (ECF subfamily)
LRRARAQLAQAMPTEDELAEPADAEQREVLERFAAAVENADTSALAELLRTDVVLEMPPFLTWFAGRSAVTGFVGSQLFTAAGDLRLVPANANGQAAFAVYRRGEDGAYRAHALQLLTLTATGISRIVAFSDASLFSSFGLPSEYPAWPVRA